MKHDMNAFDDEFWSNLDRVVDESEIMMVYEMQNESEYMKGILILR